MQYSHALPIFDFHFELHALKQHQVNAFLHPAMVKRTKRLSVPIGQRFESQIRCSLGLMTMNSCCPDSQQT